MRTDLVATFTNALGSRHDWTYKELNADLPIPVIKEACELLTSLDIFEKDGVKLFDSLVTAKIVTTTETIIFDKTKDLPREKESSLEVTAMKNQGIEKGAGRLLKAKNPLLMTFEGLENRKEITDKTLLIPAIASPLPVVPNQQLQEHEAIKPTEKETPGGRRTGHSSDPINALPNSEPHSLENGHRLKQVLARFWRRKPKNKEASHIKEVKKE